MQKTACLRDCDTCVTVCVLSCTCKEEKNKKIKKRRKKQ